MSFIGGLLFAIGTFIIGVIFGIISGINLIVNAFIADENKMLDCIHEIIEEDNNGTK